MKRKEYYADILNQINPQLLIDADEYYKDCKEKGFSVGQFDLSEKDYQYVSRSYHEEAVRRLEYQVEHYKSSAKAIRVLFEKEKLSKDKQVALRDPDFTKLRRIREYMDELFDRKKRLEDEE